MNKEDLIYLAGIIDADGWITIKKTIAHKERKDKGYLYYQAVLGLAQVEKEAIDLFCTTFNCKYVVRKPFNPKHRNIYCITLGAKKAIKVITLLSPFLKIKKERALTVLDFDRICKNNLLQRNKGKITEKDKKNDHVFYLKMKNYNLTGMRK
jgi:hypothetical protein